MTAEEREEEETWKTQQGQEERLWSMADRLAYQQSVRRVFDPHYESPEEVAVSASEEEPEEEEDFSNEFALFYGSFQYRRVETSQVTM